MSSDLMNETILGNLCLCLEELFYIFIFQSDILSLDRLPEIMCDTGVPHIPPVTADSDLNGAVSLTISNSLHVYI